MNFDAWWEKYKWNAGLEQGAYDAYNEGLKEGLRRAQVARTDTTQGGGSQEHQIDTWSDEGQAFIRANFR